MPDMEDSVDLAGLLTIWPITRALAVHISVGDLINLSRSSSSLRSVLHGRVSSPETTGPTLTPSGRNLLRPPVGRHQTSDWAYLKSIAPFTCSSTTHTRGRDTKPCRYCSRPICDACIVRDSFKHPNEKTFQNRLRYFCKECWSEGRRTRSFKFPPLSDYEYFEAEDRSQSIDTDEFCECNLKDNGWLCLECKSEQNSSDSMPTKLPKVRAIKCYGLDCTNTIDAETSDKDRRRVCLWCQRPLRRQWGGEDRYAFNLKTWADRAANAESRSRDIEEYNRRRMKTLRMSRNEMRGTTNPDDDLPIFVRHLDTVNYRNWMAVNSIPGPEAVWKSKNGHWTYNRNFLIAAWHQCSKATFTTINGVKISDLCALTQDVSLTHARLNKDIQSWHLGMWARPLPDPHDKRWKARCLNELKARILDVYFSQGEDMSGITKMLSKQYGLPMSESGLQRAIWKWLDRPVRVDGRNSDKVDPGTTESSDGEKSAGSGEEEQEEEQENQDGADVPRQAEMEEAADEAGESPQWEESTGPVRPATTMELPLQTNHANPPPVLNAPPEFAEIAEIAPDGHHEDDPPPYDA